MSATATAEPVPDREASADVPRPDAVDEVAPPSDSAEAAPGEQTSSTGKGSSSSKGSGRKRGPKGGRKSLQRDLERLIAMVGTGIATVEPFDGTVVLENSERLARALDDAAKQSEPLHRALSLLTSGSGGLGGVALALAPVVLPIAKHHGLLPDAPAVTQLVDGMTPESARAVAATMRPDEPGPTSVVETIIGRTTPGPGAAAGEGST